jgi:hypothetical protein
MEVVDHGVVALPSRPGTYDVERVADPSNVPHFASARGDRDHAARGRELRRLRPRRRTVLASEAQARGPVDQLRGRLWRIENPEKLSALGEPVSQVGFKLKPTGFFDGNPALDMPRSAAHCRHA